MAVLDDDDLFDPIVAVNRSFPANTHVLDLGTVGNTDIDIATGSDGVTRMAWVAQGEMADTRRTFRRLYISELPPLP